MNTIPLLITAAIVLPLAVLAGWAWHFVRRTDQLLGAGFEGMHWD